MAKKDDPINYNMKQINQFAGNIKDGMNQIYANTYFNTIQNNKDLDDIRKGIDSSISKIISRNYNSIGMPSITHLYTRLNDTGNEKLKDLEKLLNDDQINVADILSSYSDQSDIRNFDQEIDSICTYMPRLNDALNMKKENVLSADTYGNDFFNAKNLSKTSDEEQSKFVDNLDLIKKNLGLVEFFEASYDNAARYGEDFVYIAPYNKEFIKLLNSKNRNSQNSSYNNLDIKLNEAGGLSIVDGIENIGIPNDINESLKGFPDFQPNLNITFESGIISSAVHNYEVITEAKTKFQRTIKDDIEFEGLSDYDNTTTDGFVDKDKERITEVNIHGCIIKRLPRDKVIPIYIEETCLGYYYFEMPESSMEIENQINKDPFYAFRTGNYNNNVDTDSNDGRMNDIIHFIANQISSAIDKKFIESNPDIRREIYMIMKNNDLFNANSSGNINVTFIPPEYIHHIYFKLDRKTHRGISDLANSLLPAKLYAAIYLTNCIGVLTRGQDKRVYYVKQTVDTNISGSLLTAINQIKKGNFGLREVNSVGQILNITGRYNDYFIPTNQGDPPIQFEIMPGQNIEIKTDLLNILEEMAVNNVDTPLELLQARESMEYATQYVMSNSKFFRKVLKRQALVNPIFSRMLTCIYNYEFNTNDIIEFTLPIPLYLRMSNITNVIENANNYTEAICNYEYPDSGDDDKKAKLKTKLMRHQLAAHVDQSLIDQYKKEIEREVSSQPSGE